MTGLTSKIARAPLLAAAMLLAPWGAFAANLPLKAPPIVPVYGWAGFYVGVNAGYSWGPWDSTSASPIFAVASTTASPKVDGWLGGLQAGYNWQFNRLVLGIEADYQITGEKASDSSSTQIGPINFSDGTLTALINQSNEWKFPWFATIRGRAGYAADDWLLYVTGGAAVGRAQFLTSTTTRLIFDGVNPFDISATAAASQAVTKWGWTAGAGVEKSFGNNLSAKLEYLYIDLGSHTFLAGTGLDTDVKLTDHILRLGLNWRFGAPVIARF